MNKLLGFYELKASSLPSIPWKEYVLDAELDSNILWSVRTAIHRGGDLNLPRRIGVNANEAMQFAKQTMQHYGENGMVIYYPYFIAEKSGTLNVFSNKIVIEAVKDDLWNLVTYSQKDVTIIIGEDKKEYIGDENFIKDNELNELLLYTKEVKRMFRDQLTEGKSILLEWSYAYKSDVNKTKIGERYLVFYEVRSVD